MLRDYIQLGQRIELRAVTRVKMNGEEPVCKVYSSKIYDILSDERLEIFMPSENQKLILLPIDTEYQMIFYGGHGLYECRVRIVDRYKCNNVYILVVEMITSLKRHQRREFYRHTCVMDIGTRELAQQEIEAAKKQQAYVVPGITFQKSFLVDISGGGLRFITNYEYEKDSYVICKFALGQKNGIKEYEVVCQVLDVKGVQKRKGYYEYRVQYITISKEAREEIIRYIFEEERKNQRVKKDS